jgi:Protein of unknown function (DUF3592)
MRLHIRSYGPSQETFWLWFGGIWLLVGVPFLAFGIIAGAQARLRHDRLDREGVETPGMVLTKSIYSSEDDSGGDHSLTYRFVTPGGRTLTDEAGVGAETWDRLTERGPVLVTYLPTDPEVHRVEGEARGYVVPLVFAALGSLLTVLGGFVFVRGWNILRRTRHVERKGVTVEGTVLEVAPGSLTINHVPQWIIHYRYVDRRGRTRRGKSGPLPPEEAHAWHAGDRGIVRFDEQHPGRSVWVGKVR